MQVLLLVFSIDYCHIVSSDVILVNVLIYECVTSMQNMSPHMKALDLRITYAYLPWSRARMHVCAVVGCLNQAHKAKK